MHLIIGRCPRVIQGNAASPEDTRNKCAGTDYEKNRWARDRKSIVSLVDSIGVPTMNTTSSVKW